ncbi:MAG: hypothetical protein JSU70_20040 [Phycisphaerales bacterium]|nr:MAG: hypothetical protein JSU70_20040 [Phycisphaerales bacterium]
MCGRFIHLISIVFVISTALTGLGQDADPSLVGWWKLDGDASDSSGSGNDGTVFGDPQWVPGRVGDAIELDGDGDYVDIGPVGISGMDPRTVAGWAKASTIDIPSWTTVFGFAPVQGGDLAYADIEVDDVGRYAVHVGSYGGDTYSYPLIDLDTEWHHFAVTYDGSGGTFYVDGEPGESEEGAIGTVDEVRIGARLSVPNYFSGLIDDVRVYNRALTEAEILGLIPPQLTAYNPNPADGAEGVIAPVLRWEAGDTAVSHRVYFGTNPNPGPAEFMTEASWTVIGLGLGQMIPGATHYWRVDEVEVDDATIHTGDVWSFTAAPLTAHQPIPHDGAKWVDTEPTLRWSLGMAAASHDVYFGTGETEVTNGAGDTFKGNQRALAYDPGGLQPDTAYYWKIDSYDSAATKYEGQVWKFTTLGPGGGIKAEYFAGTSLSGVPILTQIEDGVDHLWGGGEVAGGISDSISARWTGELEVAFTERYTFYTNSDDGVRLYLDGKLIISNWTNHGAEEDRCRPILLEAGQRYAIVMEWYENTGQAVAQLFWESAHTPKAIIPAGPLQPPVRARNPKPRNGATAARQTPTLRWTAGDKAVQHDVYFGSDQAAVAGADPTTPGVYRGRLNLTTTSYVPTEAPLEWDKTFFWRVDEVNGLDMWKGSLWSFTTANYIVVDDFEDYNDYSPDRIFQTWIDGFGFTDPPPGNPGNSTGSTVGYTEPPFTEQTIVHGGAQSMPFGYDNTGATGKARYSEAEREWPSSQDWTRNGVKAFALWFHGNPANAPGPLYVGLQDSAGTRKDVSQTDPTLVQQGRWQQWNIELTEFTGVSLATIKKVYIGVGNRISPVVGGTGSLFIDGIGVHPPRCVASLLQPENDLNDDCIVDYADLVIMAGEWLGSGAGLTADLDADDDVDFGDYADLADSWLDEALWPQQSAFE